MSVPQRGLRSRIEIESRRIPSQHRQLDQLYGALVDALDPKSPEGARTAFRRFREACCAHFAMEDEVYFPALHGLRPELDGELAALVEEHRALAAALERMESWFPDTGPACGAEAELDRFVTRLAAHEGREERFLDSLRARGEASGGTS